jgi:Tfp pilus assembly protein PilX
VDPVGRLVRSQEGVALPVATAMMLVISLLVVAFFSVSLRVNDTSIDDRSTKRALAAAEAGLQMAVYRLNRIGTTQPTQCLTTGWVPLSGGQCPGLTESLGNGAQYTYYVTPEQSTLPAAQRTCVLLPGQTLGNTDRCITVVGTASGVERRVQVRASTLTSAASFKSVGLMSKSLMYAGNSSEITSNVGVNGVAHFGNSAKTFANSSAGIAGAVMRAPGSAYQTSGSGQVIAGGQQSVSTPFEFPATDFEAAEIAALTTNLKTSPAWSAPSGSSYDATTKQFTVTGEATMPAGTYYFCRVRLASGAKWRFSSTQATQIYVDSPSRPGSLCTGQADPAGTFTAENSNEINKDGREDLLDIFVHGTSYNGTRSAFSWCTPAGDMPHTDKCESDFLLNNSAWFEGSVYAPNTTVEVNNSGTWIGAIGADKIRFNNSVKFELTSAVKDSAPTSTGGVRRDTWAECSPQPPVTGDPESGC